MTGKIGECGDAEDEVVKARALMFTKKIKLEPCKVQERNFR